MQIIFAHGLGSSANAKKITRLAQVAEQFGHTTYRINDTDTRDPDERAARLIAKVKDIEMPLLLVGSSMGAYTCVVAAPYCRDLHGLFLIAPALYMPGYQHNTYPRDLPATDIVHGWHDEIIPYQNSLRFAQTRHAALHLIAGNHTLHHAISDIVGLFTQFLQKISTA